EVAGDRGAFHVTGQGTLDALRLELAPAQPAAKPLVIEEPRVALGCEADVDLAALDVELRKLTIESGMLRGGAQGRLESLRGLGTGELVFHDTKGDFLYVPDRLGAVLAPWLPGRLSGKEEQRLTFTLDGRAKELDWRTLLRNSTAHLDLGLGQFARPEIEL